jgi:hypothetical protein
MVAIATGCLWLQRLVRIYVKGSEATRISRRNVPGIARLKPCLRAGGVRENQLKYGRLRKPSAEPDIELCRNQLGLGGRRRLHFFRPSLGHRRVHGECASSLRRGASANSGGLERQQHHRPQELYSITGNYRFQWQRRKLGAYFIGGGGWYYRTLGFTGPVSLGTGNECVPAWIWWGFTCKNGTVIANQSRGSYSSSVLGGNVGARFTIKVGGPSYRIYIEPRYHYAPTQNVSTHLLEVTLGSATDRLGKPYKQRCGE